MNTPTEEKEEMIIPDIDKEEDENEGEGELDDEPFLEQQFTEEEIVFKDEIVFVNPSTGSIKGGEFIQVFISLSEETRMKVLLNQNMKAQIFKGCTFGGVAGITDEKSVFHISERSKVRGRDTIIFEVFRATHFVLNVCTPMNMKNAGKVDISVNFNDEEITKKDGFEFIKEEDETDQISEDKEYRTLLGGNPIFFAVAQNRLDLLRYYVEEKGFDIISKDKLGYTPYEVAKFYKREKIISYIESQFPPEPVEVEGEEDRDYSMIMYHNVNQNNMPGNDEENQEEIKILDECEVLGIVDNNNFRSIHFTIHGKPVNKIISYFSPDFCVIDYPSTNKVIKRITMRDGLSFRGFIKWDSYHIISSCSSDEENGIIRVYNLNHPSYNFELINEYRTDHFIGGILKLDDKLFAAACSMDSIFIFDFDSFKVLKDVCVGDNSGFLNALKSKNYSDCFYISIHDSAETVKLVNYKKEMIVKQFKTFNEKYEVEIFDHDEYRDQDEDPKLGNGPCGAISLFYKKPQNIEFLIACRLPNQIYIFNTKEEKYNVRINYLEKKWWGFGKRYGSVRGSFRSTHVINDQYLFSSDSTGKLFIHEIIFHNGMEVKLKKLRNKKMRNHGTVDFKFPEQEDVSESKLKFVSTVLGNQNAALSGYVVDGLKFKKWEEIIGGIEQDRMERRLFLSESKEKFVFRKKDMKVMFFKIKLRNIQFSDCFKVFF